MKRLYWSPELPVPETLRSNKPLVILDSCALFLLFRPQMMEHISIFKKTTITERLNKLMDPKIETSVVVFDFILNEAEIEEKKIFGEKTMKKSLKQKNVFLVKTDIRGLRAAARTIDMIPHKHEVIKKFDSFYSIDSALIVCTRRLAQEGVKVYIATIDRAMTEHLQRWGIPNFFKEIGISF